MYDAENQKEFLDAEFDVNTTSGQYFNLHKKPSYEDYKIKVTFPVPMTQSKQFDSMIDFIHTIFVIEEWNFLSETDLFISSSPAPTRPVQTG